MKVPYFLLFFISILTWGVFAQDSVAQVSPTSEETVPYAVSGPTNDGYVEPTYQNLSKMYWAIGKFDREDDAAIDNYLQINECDLYLQYYHNDFDWAKIREATREHIQEKLSGMSNKFELVAPIRLGRYDLEKEEFEVEDESKVRGIRNIDFNMNDHKHNSSCAQRGELEGYPSNMIVLLNRPVVVEKVPVKKNVAELFLEEEERESVTRGRKPHESGRQVFLRLKIDVTQYKDTVRVANGTLRAVVYGRLEGYEIYADSQKMKPLYYYKVNDREAKRRLRRKRTESATVETEEKGESKEPSSKETYKEFSDLVEDSSAPLKDKTKGKLPVFQDTSQ